MARGIFQFSMFAALFAGGLAAHSQGVTAFMTSSRSLQAVNYRQDGDSKIGFKGTALASTARGQAEVNVARGVVRVDAKLDRMPEPSSYGPEFLTYVLWAVTPEGRARNLGELISQGGKASLKTSVPLQEFGLFVTAEPYFSVTVPSYAVVAENVIVAGTQGKTTTLDVKVELFQRGYYSGVRATPADAKLPESLRQARLAVQVAQAAGAHQYATESFAKAQAALQQAELYQSRKGNNRKPIEMVAREAAQTAEDSRVIAVKRQVEEKVQKEREAAQRRESEAKAAADREAQRATLAIREKQQADAARTSAEQQSQLAMAETRAATAEKEAALIARREAENERRLALAASTQAEKDKQAAQAEKEQAIAARKQAEEQRQLALNASAEAEKRSKAAMADMDAARQAAAEADMRSKIALADREGAQKAAEAARRLKEEAEKERALMADERNRAIADKQALRARLLEQFNKVLETRDTERGLVLNMGDVLFDTGKFDLRPVARERLARVSGIASAYPGLKLDIEGHTDSTGSDALNQRLSEQRAAEVALYLSEQQIPRDKIQSRGFGKARPVASNDAADGRQKNRRVEIVISGEVIGTSIGDVVKK